MPGWPGGGGRGIVLGRLFRHRQKLEQAHRQRAVSDEARDGLGHERAQPTGVLERHVGPRALGARDDLEPEGVEGLGAHLDARPRDALVHFARRLPGEREQQHLARGHAEPADEVRRLRGERGCLAGPGSGHDEAVVFVADDGLALLVVERIPEAGVEERRATGLLSNDERLVGGIDEPAPLGAVATERLDVLNDRTSHAQSSPRTAEQQNERLVARQPPLPEPVVDVASSVYERVKLANGGFKVTGMCSEDSAPRVCQVDPDGDAYGEQDREDEHEWVLPKARGGGAMSRPDFGVIRSRTQVVGLIRFDPTGEGVVEQDQQAVRDRIACLCCSRGRNLAG